MSKSRAAVLNIAKYTMADVARQKSFLVILAVSVLFVFLARGCYHGNYMVNGRELEAAAVVGMVSKMTFQVIAALAMMVAALLSMRVFKRDRDEGMQACIFSKPITRRQYLFGKVFGLWLLSSFLMFALHAAVFVTVLLELHAAVPSYLGASLLCTVNLLFAVISVCFFSLMMPDVAAFLLSMGIGVTSFLMDGVFAISYSPMARAMMKGWGIPEELTGWKIVYYLWPKIFGSQRFAAMFIHGERPGCDEMYPFLNIVIWCVAAGALLLWRFRKEEIS
jgi:ABC-type transport system involved in multi-copper enzyme maturation permease subunit